MAKKPLIVGGLVFLLVALAHLARIVFGFEITLNGNVIPRWVNGVGFVVAGGLSLWMLKTAKKV